MNNSSRERKKYERDLKKYERELRAYDYIQQALKHESLGDLKCAVGYLRRAAELNSIYAQTTLATILDDKIKPAQVSEARYWYKRAVRAGDHNAAWDLAMHYGARQNLRWYLYWLNVAEKMGDPDANEEKKKKTWWKKFERRNAEAVGVKLKRKILPNQSEPPS